MQNEKQPVVEVSKHLEDQTEAEARTCCCCKCSTKCMIITFVVIALILCGLGIAAFFLYPRIPEVTFVSFDVAKGATLKIKSENYIDVTVNSVKGNITHANEQVGTFNKGSFVVAARDTTLVTIPVSITITGQAVKTCSQSSSIKGHVDLLIDLKLISWTGKKIKHALDINIPCPKLDKSDLEARIRANPGLLAEMGIDINDIDPDDYPEYTS